MCSKDLRVATESSGLFGLCFPKRKENAISYLVRKRANFITPVEILKALALDSGARDFKAL